LGKLESIGKLKMKSLLVTLIVLIQTSVSMAFIKEGSMSGGIARGADTGPLSLLKVEKLVTEKAESIVFTIGDKTGFPLGTPGFFHVTLDEAGKRLIVDLSQVQQTAVDKEDLQKIMKLSNLVQSADIVMDPVDQSMNLTFIMKKPVLAKANASKSGNGQFTIELQGVK
jgi:hypothetical protein